MDNKWIRPSRKPIVFNIKSRMVYVKLFIWLYLIVSRIKTFWLAEMEHITSVEAVKTITIETLRVRHCSTAA